VVEAEKLVAGKMAGEVALVQCSQTGRPIWLACEARPGQARQAEALRRPTGPVWRTPRPNVVVE